MAHSVGFAGVPEHRPRQVVDRLGFRLLVAGIVALFFIAWGVGIAIASQIGNDEDGARASISGRRRSGSPTKGLRMHRTLAVPTTGRAPHKSSASSTSTNGTSTTSAFLSATQRTSLPVA